ncbi:MAG TPA: 4Fe-4S binding protein [Dehalococcoidia bacterium]|nr:4Fe-4S binding protein [Dehalococcoidia bacterium]
MAVVTIDLAECINCGWCRRTCPTETIRYFATGRRTHVVDPDGCIDCGICVKVCPVNCIYPVADYVVAPDKLAAAKLKAKAYAARQRKIKLDREDVARATIARLAARSVAHA